MTTHAGSEPVIHVHSDAHKSDGKPFFGSKSWIIKCVPVTYYTHQPPVGLGWEERLMRAAAVYYDLHVSIAGLPWERLFTQAA